MVLRGFSADVPWRLLGGVAGDVLKESTSPDKEVMLSIGVGVHHPEQPAPHLLISWRWCGGADHASTGELSEKLVADPPGLGGCEQSIDDVNVLGRRGDPEVMQPLEREAAEFRHLQPPQCQATLPGVGPRSSAFARSFARQPR